MKIHPNAIVLLLLTLIMGACIYSSNGTYNVDPVPGTPATVLVTTSLDTMNGPTVKDSLGLGVEYKIQIRNGEPYFLDCAVEDYVIFDLGFYYDSDLIYVFHPDSVLNVVSDTTLFVLEPDTLLVFIRDTLAGSYSVEGSFLIPGNLPVLPGDNTLNIYFYYSANTNSLGDILKLEAEVKELEYSVLFEGGATK